MRVFMLGWEFPPFISGGLGTACYGLTKAMSALGTSVMFVLPRPISSPFSSHVSVLAPDADDSKTVASTEFRMDEFENVTFRTVNASLNPYATATEFADPRVDGAGTPATSLHDGQSSYAQSARPGSQNVPPPVNYSGDLLVEVQRYAGMASAIARGQTFDVVHAHDWMTFAAGLAIAAQSGCPLVVHVHSTEFDRAGAHVDQRIYDIERRGLHGAMKIIAVSYFTKSMIVQHYGIDPKKIEVVYNAVEYVGQVEFDLTKFSIAKNEKVVLFLGRITQQKGPEYFLSAAKKVLEIMDNVKFVMAGTGDMVRRTIEAAAAMGIGHKILFTGFLRGADVERIFKMADLYVMPSVSEPFGIAPLEAMSRDVPVIISKQSGVSEILQHVLKVDFWDVNEMANKIIAVLRHPPLARTLREQGGFEVGRMNWTDSARSCLEVYDSALAGMGTPESPH